MAIHVITIGFKDWIGIIFICKLVFYGDLFSDYIRGYYNLSQKCIYFFITGVIDLDFKMKRIYLDSLHSKFYMN